MAIPALSEKLPKWHFLTHAYNSKKFWAQGMREKFGSAGAVCSIKESSGPQNQRVQKVMSQRSAGSCTLCTRANAFPGAKLLFLKCFESATK
jgi:hypothetical protein